MTPSKRRVVAEAVTGQPHEWKNPWSAGGHDVLFMVGGESWQPEEDVYQWGALTRKCAELIEALPNEVTVGWNKKGYWDSEDRKSEARTKLCKALATNNTDAIEQLVYELITGDKT